MKCQKMQAVYRHSCTSQPSPTCRVTLCRQDSPCEDTLDDSCCGPTGLPARLIGVGSLLRMPRFPPRWGVAVTAPEPACLQAMQNTRSRSRRVGGRQRNPVPHLEHSSLHLKGWKGDFVVRRTGMRDRNGAWEMTKMHHILKRNGPRSKKWGK